MDETQWYTLNNEITVQMNSEEDDICDLTESEIQGDPGSDTALQLQYMNKSIKGG